MTWSSIAGPWGDLRARFRDASTHRSWTIDANDGIIATAGLLFGFAGAGASNRVLLFTATAATIAGGLSVGGASWAEQAAERDAQLLYAKRESEDLAADPEGELEELTRHWEQRGLRPDTAREVARQLSQHDALAAQLEWEYSFVEPVPATFPIWFGVTPGFASSPAIGSQVRVASNAPGAFPDSPTAARSLSQFVSPTSRRRSVTCQTNPAYPRRTAFCRRDRQA